MAGKRGRSGPPGNLNGARHPWKVFWRRRALRLVDRWILPVLESYEGSLESDKPDMTETERRMAEIAQEARGTRMLIWADLGRDGHTPEERQALLTSLPPFMSVEMRALLAIGLGRRALKVPELQAYLESKYPAVAASPQEGVPAAPAATTNGDLEGGKVPGPGQLNELAGPQTLQEG